MAHSKNAMLGMTAFVVVLGGGLGCGEDVEGAGGQGGATTSGTTTGSGATGGGDGGTTSSGGATSSGGGGAGTGGGMCGDAGVMAQYAACVATDDQASCEAAGGTWSTVGLSPASICVCPTGQDGCVCTRSTDCVAACIAPTSGGVMECNGVTAGTCAEAAPFAGCWCWFDEDGQVSGMCVD